MHKHFALFMLAFLLTACLSPQGDSSHVTLTSAVTSVPTETAALPANTPAPNLKYNSLARLCKTSL
jgi:hypothetical protein